ncbi:MAG: exodeoxyribonuclease V subunit alpha [Syntrophales bacterium]|nr:exodeoxyribonuclease V subunit alpha [Syntrophales bacterium]
MQINGLYRNLNGKTSLPPLFSELDIRFGRFMEKISGKESPSLFLAAALTSHYRTLGLISIDLTALAGRAYWVGDDVALSSPNITEWLNILDASPVVGKPREYRPLILSGSRLYLYRYWKYEEQLADLLKKRANFDVEGIDEDILSDGLKRLFPPEGEDDKRWPRLAAFTAVCKHLCIISGGPGTGKTSTVAKILALILEQNRGKPLRIALAAPTGKAASRLLEAIHDAKSALNCGNDIIAAMPERSSTIHRLLGSVPHSPSYRYHAGRQLPVDVVIIDEASMVDLALFSHLLQAVPPGTRLIILGDKDQLASVEAGAVFGDLCESGHDRFYTTDFLDRYQRIAGDSLPSARIETSPISDTIVFLRYSYRFSKTSGIHALSIAVNEGLGDQSLSLLKGKTATDIAWHALPRPDDLATAMEDLLLEGYRLCLETTEPDRAFQLFNSFRILCTLREGPYGSLNLNRLIERALLKRRLIRRDTPLYTGRPIMILRNDYNLRLFNGDVGIVLPDPLLDNELRVFFPSEDGAFRSFPLFRLPEHETVFALTVHKSQGSEFDNILLMLSDRDTPVLTRELIYTGITRAKKMIHIWGRENIFQQAVLRRMERISGLRDVLQDTYARGIASLE